MASMRLDREVAFLIRENLIPVRQSIAEEILRLVPFLSAENGLNQRWFLGDKGHEPSESNQ